MKDMRITHYVAESQTKGSVIFAFQGISKCLRVLAALTVDLGEASKRWQFRLKEGA